MAVELGYRSLLSRRGLAGTTATRMLAMVVADITNPVFFGMIRGAELTAAHAGYATLLLESQESEPNERALLERVIPAVDGVILTSSRLSDGAIRTAAKEVPMVVLNRLVSQVPSVASDNIRAVKRAIEHLAGAGHRSITYLAGPEASWADGMRWRGVLEACHELDLAVRRLGPHLPTMAGGRVAAERWLGARSTAVVAYNDLVAIGFMQTVSQAQLEVPDDVSVLGFDNIRDAELVRPHLTTIAAPLVSLGSAAVNHLLKTGITATRSKGAVVLPARLIIRGSTGPARRRATGAPGPR